MGRALVALVASLLWGSQAGAAPGVVIGSVSGTPGERVTLPISYLGTGSGVEAFQVIIRFPNEHLSVDLDTCGSSLRPPITYLLECESLGLASIRLTGTSSVGEITDRDLGDVRFTISADAPVPATLLVEVSSEQYSANPGDVRPKGSRDGFVAVQSPDPLPPLDRFEDDDSALSAKPNQSLPRISDTRWFDSADDEDWFFLATRSFPAIDFNVCNGACGDSGEITPNVRIYDETRLVNPAAAPIAEFGECESNGVPVTPGTEIVGAAVDQPRANAVYLFQITDCFGLFGSEFRYDVFAVLSTADRETANVSGLLSDPAGNPVQAFILASTNQVTATDPATGHYKIAVLSGAPFSLTVLTNGFPSLVAQVDALAPNESFPLDLELRDVGIFSNGFE